MLYFFSLLNNKASYGKVWQEACLECPSRGTFRFILMEMSALDTLEKPPFGSLRHVALGWDLRFLFIALGVAAGTIGRGHACLFFVIPQPVLA